MAWEPPEDAIAWEPPEDAVAVDTLPAPQTATQQWQARTAQKPVQQSPEWWAARRQESAFADADPVSRMPAIISEPYRAVAGAATDIAGAVARPFSKDVADYFAATGQQIAADSESLRSDDWSPWASRMYGGAVQSLTQSAIAAPLGGAGIIASFALTEGNKALYEAEQAGLKGADRLKYAAVQGAIEGTIATIFQKFAPGMESFIPQIAKGGMKLSGKQFLNMTKQELPEELLTELGHAMAEEVSGVNNNAMAPGEFVPRMIDTVAQTLMTLGLAQGTARLAQGRQKVAELEGIVEKGFVSEQEAEQLGLTPEESKNRASRKKAVQDRIDQLQQETEQLEKGISEDVSKERGKGSPPIPLAPSGEAQTTQEPSDASTVPSAETEVREGEGRPDLRRQGQVEVPAKPAGEVAPAPEVPVAPVQTAREEAKAKAAGLVGMIQRKRTEAAPAASAPPAPTPPQTPPEAAPAVEAAPPAQPAPAATGDDARVDEIIKVRWGGRTGNTKQDAMREEIARREVVEEKEMVQKYPPGTTLTVKGYERTPYEVQPDGNLKDTTTGRQFGRAPGAILRQYKPSEITVVSKPEAAPEAPPEVAPAAPTTFTTAKGSTYEFAEGRTVRTKSQHQFHDPKDVGVKPRSDRTVFVDPEFAREIGGWQGSSAEGKRIVERDGKLILTSINPKTGQRGKDGETTFTEEPQVGMSPVELWARDRDGFWKGNHPGNEITSIGEPASLSPREKAIEGKQPLRRSPTPSDEAADAAKVEAIRREKKMQGRVQKAAPEAAPAKEPWQMTRDEFAKKQAAIPASGGFAARANYKIGKAHHRHLVTQAMSEGKPVPPEVLKDYPDLASKAPTQPQNASAAESGPTVVPKPETLPEAAQEPTKQVAGHGSLPMFSVYPTQFRGVKKYAVKEFDKGGFGDAIFGTEAEAQAHADISKQNHESDVAWADKAKADAEAAQKKQKEHEESFSGFLSADPKTKGRQLKTLGANVKYKGKVVTRKALIDSKVADGWVVTDQGRLQGPDESFLDARDLTETGIKYARHQAELRSRKPNMILGSPSEPGSGEDSEAETGRKPNTVFGSPLTFDQYSAQQGVPSTPPSFPETHRTPRRPSKATQKATGRRIAKAGADWQKRRDELRAEYDAKVASGEIRQPTRRERLESTAQGEGEAAEAARRLLAKEPSPEAASKPKSFRKPKKPSDPQTLSQAVYQLGGLDPKRLKAGGVNVKQDLLEAGVPKTVFKNQGGGYAVHGADTAAKALESAGYWKAPEGSIPGDALIQALKSGEKTFQGMDVGIEEDYAAYQAKQAELEQETKNAEQAGIAGPDVEETLQAGERDGAIEGLSEAEASESEAREVLGEVDFNFGANDEWAAGAGVSGEQQELFRDKSAGNLFNVGPARKKAKKERQGPSEMERLEAARREEHIESAPGQKTMLRQAADDALKDAQDKADKLRKKLGGDQLFSNPMLDPEIIAETGGVVYAYAKAGFLEFAAFIEQLATDIGQTSVDDLFPLLRSEWNKLHATGEFVGMTDSDGSNPVKAPAPKAASDDTTGTKHAKTDELRKKIGLGERVKPGLTTQEELDEEAKRLMQEDPNLAARMAADVVENPRGYENKVEVHVLRRYIQELDNRREDGEDVFDEQAIAVQAANILQSEWGSIGRASQEVTAPDFSLPGLIRQHSDSVKQEPSRDEQAKYAKLADQVKELEADKQKLQEQLVEEQVARAAAESAKPAPKAKLGTKKAMLRKKADEAIANFKQAWAALGQMGIISDPKAEAEKLKAIERAAIDVVKVYAELGINSAVEFMAGVASAFKGITAKQKKSFREAWDKYHEDKPIASPMGADPDKATLGARAKALTRAAVESGIEDWNEVIDAVHEQMAKEVKGFTRSQTMEAISDYGQYRMLSKDAIDTKVRAIRGKARQALKLEDLNKAIVASRKWLDEGMSPEDVAQKLHDQDLLPKATGSERATPDSIERGLIAEFNRLKKELPVSTATREGQLKSAMSTAKTSARNRLEDYGKEIEALEEAIAKKVALEKTSDRVPLTPDPELADLRKRVEERREKRDELKEQYETIFPPTKRQRQVTAQQQTQRAEQAIDKLKQELKDIQSGKEKGSTQKPNLVPAQLQQQLQMWRERLKAARKAAQEADAARWEDEGGAVMPAPGRKPLTDEQRLKMAENMVRRQTDIVKADIKALEQGTWKPAEAGQSPTSETKQKLEQELEALKEIREQARKASPQYQAREEAKYWEQYRKNQEKQLEFWENRLQDAKAGILPSPRKKRTPTEKAILDKAIEIEAVQYRALAEIEKAKRAQWNAGQWIGAGLNELTSTLPRNLMAGLEMSVVGRQGIFYTGSHPIMALSTLARSMQAAFSQRIALANMEDIKARPNFPEYGIGDVEFTKHDGPAKDLEEMFSSGIMRWLENTEGLLWLPLRTLAKAYMASERGFSTFRNAMTADLYDIQKRDTLAIRGFFSKHGIETRPWGETDIKEAGRSANIFGGRGTGLKQGGKALNWFFFARRWIWATIQREFILPFQLATPKFIGQWNGDAAMRIAHAKLYAQFAAGMAANLAAQYWLFYLLSDDDDDKPEISFDLISTDLLKLKVGDTRIDFLGGMQQPIVLAARLLSGKSINAEGEVYSLYNDGGDEKPWRDSADVLIQWGRGKLGPGPSGILDWLSGQNLIGEQKTKTDIVLERIQPMTYRELWQAEDELGLKRGTITFIDGFFGAGVNTYGPRTEYRSASEAERLEMVEKDLKNLKWDAPPEPAYAEFLTEDQLQAFRDRRTEKRQSVLLAATHEPIRETHKNDETFAESVATRDKNIGFLREMKAEGVTLEEASQLLEAHYAVDGRVSRGERKNLNEKLAKLAEIYGE